VQIFEHFYVTFLSGNVHDLVDFTVRSFKVLPLLEITARDRFFEILDAFQAAKRARRVQNVTRNVKAASNEMFQDFTR
jgi:hypothetical protein